MGAESLTSDQLELVAKLSDFVSPDVLSAALDVPLQFIRSLTVTRTTLIPEDSQLAEGIRALSWRAINVANEMLEFGTADQRLAVVRTVLSGATRLLGKEAESSTEEGRAALERLWSSQRVSPINVSSTTTPS